MYEENLKPLPEGDFARVFADQLTAVERQWCADPLPKVTPTTVVRWARREVQPPLETISRRLLLPGSGITGVEFLAQLTEFACQGKSCIVCLNHRSNLDVPTLRVLLEDNGHSDVFQRLIWIAGRKLHEDLGATPLLVQAYHQVVVSPRSWMKTEHSDEELREAHQINLAAHRAIHKLKSQQWIFALFPGGTRMRVDDEASRKAIPETDSYLKNFEYLLLGRIDGCTLPVSRDRAFTHEKPILDRVRFTFGPVRRTADWRADASRRYPTLDQRSASAEAIVEDINAIEPQGPPGGSVSTDVERK